jgi:hypothetical protein
MRDLGVAQTLGDDLGAGVAGAADDDREPDRPLAEIVAGVRELDLPGQVIAHVQRLRDAVEAVRVLGHARIGSSLCKLPVASTNRSYGSRPRPPYGSAYETRRRFSSISRSTPEPEVDAHGSYVDGSCHAVA